MKLFRKLDLFTVGIAAVLIYFIVLLFITYSNYFSRTITIKEKISYGMGKYMQSVVMDTTGAIYTVHNMYLVLNFDAINDYAMLEIGKTYRVSGYGISIPFLQIFPNIIQVSPA
jgi:hypothetical protein